MNQKIFPSSWPEVKTWWAMKNIDLSRQTTENTRRTAVEKNNVDLLIKTVEQLKELRLIKSMQKKIPWIENEQ